MDLRSGQRKQEDQRDGCGWCGSSGHLTRRSPKCLHHKQYKQEQEAKKTFVYTGQNRGEIPRTVEHLIVDASVEEIQCQAFQGFKSLTKVTIKSGVMIIGEKAFDRCNNLTEVVVPCTVVEVGQGAFRDCYNLGKIALEDGLKTIKARAFQECFTVKEVAIPSTVETIEANAFLDCINLRHVNLNVGLKQIERRAFAGCTALMEIKIPSTVTHFARHVFLDCDNLQSIDVEGQSFALDIWLSTAYPRKTPQITMSRLVSQYFFNPTRTSGWGWYGWDEWKKVEKRKLKEIHNVYIDSLRELVEWRSGSGNVALPNRKRKAESWT